MILGLVTCSNPYSWQFRASLSNSNSATGFSWSLEDSKILISQDLPRFQDTDFPRCTIILQDFKDFKILIFQAETTFSQYFLRFQETVFLRFTKICKDSNMIRDHLRFIKIPIYWSHTQHWPSGFFGTRPSHNPKTFDFQRFEISNTNTWKRFGSWSIPGSRRIVDTSGNPEIIEMRTLRFLP